MKPGTKIKYWTEEEKTFIFANKHLGYRAIAESLGVTWQKVEAFFKNHKIRTGNKTTFKKRHQTWNKGLHIRLSPKSEFKKGIVPHNTLSDGTISIRKDKRGIPYKFIRVSLSVLIPFAHFTWQQAFGPVPKNHVVIHKDGDSLNCDIANLQLITKRENMVRNANREKATIANKKAWAEGKRYQNDHYIATTISKDPEVVKEILKDKALIELKRQQLINKRQLKLKQTDGQNTEH